MRKRSPSITRTYLSQESRRADEDGRERQKTQGELPVDQETHDHARYEGSQILSHHAQLVAHTFTDPLHVAAETEGNGRLGFLFVVRQMQEKIRSYR